MGTMRAALQRGWLAVLLTLVMAATTSCSRAGQPAPTQQQPGTREASRRPSPVEIPREIRDGTATLDLLEQYGPGAARGNRDVATLAAELGTDPAKAFEFVRDRIAHHVYPGILRGAEGTLAAGAGNSFDKSLLLGSVLRAHGMRVRYVSGRLNEERAARLIQQMFDAAPPTSVATPGAVPSTLSVASDELPSAIISRWLETVESVRKVIESSHSKVSGSALQTPDDLAREASDHAWIEYMTEDKWVALDPSFKDAKPGETFADPASVSESIPDAVAHHVTIRVRIEELAGGALTAREVLRYRSASSDLAGTLVFLAHRLEPTPDGWTAAPELQVGPRRIRGQIVAGSGLGAGAQQLGERVSDRLGRTARGRGRGDLVAEWIDVEFAYPGGRTETVSRTLFDRARAARGQVPNALRVAPMPLMQGIPAPLLGVHVLSFHSGPQRPARALAVAVSYLPDLKKVMATQAALLASGRQPRPEDVERFLADAGAVLPKLLHLRAQSFQLASAEIGRVLGGSGVMFYEASPRLTIASLELAPRTNGQGFDASFSIDLRRNALRGANTGVPPRAVAWANVIRGLLDSVIEHALTEELPLFRSSAVSTVSIIRNAQEQGIPLKVLTKTSDVDALGVADELKARLRASVDGALLIAPERPVLIGGTQRLAWWQIDPASGETLGVLDDGLHGAVERNFRAMAHVQLLSTGIEKNFSKMTGIQLLKQIVAVGGYPGAMIGMALIQNGHFVENPAAQRLAHMTIGAIVGAVVVGMLALGAGYSRGERNGHERGYQEGRRLPPGCQRRAGNPTDIVCP